MKNLPEQNHGERIWLIDASIYVFRSWFVRSPLPLDRDGNPVNAVYGFLRFVYQVLYEQNPQQIAVAFDTSLQSSVRKTIYPGYKANRTSAPEELKYQFQLCRDFLAALGIAQATHQHHEADDVLGTWATQQRSPERQIIVLSGDKDLAQLIAGNDLWWDYGRRKAMNPGGIKSEFGVWPDQIADQLAIAGDKADNIPGVPGVGMSMAAKLLKRFGTLDNMLNNIPLIGQMQVHGAKRLQLLVHEHQATIRLARQLTGIDCNVPDIPLDLRRGTKDLERLQALCTQLGLSAQQQQLWEHI